MTITPLMVLTYARDRGHWHVHLVRRNPRQPDQLAESAICGIARYSPTWPHTGHTELRYKRMCKLCIRSMRARKLDYPPLPLFAQKQTD